MWDFFTRLIDVFPSWFPSVVVVSAMVWFVSCCLRARSPWPFRRDKAGHIYLYSAAYQENKERLKEAQTQIDEVQDAIIKQIQDVVNDMNIRFTRVELLDLMNHHPECVKEIIDLHLRYTSLRTSRGLPPNGYTSDVLYKSWFDKWAVDRGKEYVDDR